MAVVQGHLMLPQQDKMYNVIHHPQSPTNCVIVSNFGQNKSVIQAKRPLAPAPERGTVLITSNNNDLRCKRKIQFMPYGGGAQQPASVARRNARERNRVKQVNNGFATLRQHIPANVLAAFSPQSSPGSGGRGANKKLSKVETLRMAVEYIRSLQQMLDDHEGELSASGVENAMVENRFYNSSPDSLSHQYQYPIMLPTPPSSEASASPTPSHSSEGSTYTTVLYRQGSYDTYDTKSTEDEELLDAIFSWQQNE